MVKSRRSDEETVEIYQLLKITEVGGWQSAVHEVPGHAGPGIEQLESVRGGRGACEFCARHTVALPVHARDDTHRCVGFSWIHRRATDPDNTNAWMTVARRR